MEKLGLLPSLKFGIEFEVWDYIWTKMDEDVTNMKQTVFNNPNFVVSCDPSITEYLDEYERLEYADYCSELSTPIMQDSVECLNDLVTALKYLSTVSKINRRCALHINIGAEILGSKYISWYNFIRILGAIEPELYRYLCDGNPIRKCAISGGYRNGFALPIAHMLRQGLVISDETDDINTLLNNCQFDGDFSFMTNKSVSLKGIYKNEMGYELVENLDLSIYGQRIEFRMPNGTLDFAIVSRNLKCLSALFKLATTLNSSQDNLLEELIQEPLPKNYNTPMNMERCIKIADLLFEEKEESEYFVATLEKTTVS